MRTSSTLSIRQLQYVEKENPKLSIVDLMIITTICAVTITVITTVGFLGVHGMLILCLASNKYHEHHLSNRPIRFRMWNQFTWGVLMPIVCVFGDPFVFGSFELGRVIYISNHGLACYTFIGIQIFTLLLSWLVPVQNVRLNEFVAGVLFVGGGFAFLLPLTIGLVAYWVADSFELGLEIGELFKKGVMEI